MNDRRWSTTHGWLTVCLLYAVIASFLIYGRYYRVLEAEGRLYALSFGYGGLVRELVETGRYGGTHQGVQFAAHRMPLIPLFLAGIAQAGGSLWTALLVKNLLLGVLFGLGFAHLAAVVGRCRPWIVPALAVFCASMPQFVHFAFCLEMEEGYLIGLLFFITVWLFSPQGAGAETLCAKLPWLLIPLLYLTKSSALLLAIVLSLLVGFMARRRSAGLLAGGSLLACILFWGMHNVVHSGHFAVGSSLDGYNLAKGNNRFTTALYPQFNLDILDDSLLAWAAAGAPDEWAWDRTYRQMAWEYVRTYPWEFGTLVGRRAWVLLIEARKVPAGIHRGLLEWVNTVHMGAFRVFLWGAILLAGVGLWDRTVERRRSAAFLLLLAGYALPYLAGFCYQRHVIPLVLPVATFLLYALDSPRGNGALDTLENEQR